MSISHHVNLRLIEVDRLPASPWRNGGGQTRELLRHPPGAGEHAWHWRLSVADIQADGPFSPYPGVQRWFAVVEGAGVTLAWPHQTLRLMPGDGAIRFDGAAAPEGHLLGGHSRDLNLMLREGCSGGRLLPAAPGLGRAGLHGRPRGLFSVSALDLFCGHDSRVAVPAMTLAWCEAGDARPWAVKAPAPPPEAGPGGDTPPPMQAFWVELLPPETR